MSISADRLARPTLRALAATGLRLFNTHPFLRFLVVGVLNTAVGYSLFLIALALMPTTFGALVVSTFLGILFNFGTIGRLVFGRTEAWRLVGFFAVYAIVFGYNAAGLSALEQAGVRAWLAGLVLLPGAVAISWLLNRGVVFRSAP